MSLSEDLVEVAMKKLVPIPPEGLNRLEKNDLKNIGYQFVSVKLNDSRVFSQAVASEATKVATSLTEAPG